MSYTVIIPAFNAARTIQAAIASALAQSAPPETVIVVDDGSTDETAAIVATFGARVGLIRQHNQGPAAATDRAIAATSAPIVAGLDADDLWLPEKAQRQMHLLGSRVDLDGVFCRAISFPHGADLDVAAPARDAWSRSTMMLRKEAIERMGAVFDDENPRGLGEMIRWFDRGRRCGLAFEMMPDALVGRRIIEGSLSSARDPRALLPMIRARLAKRP